MERNNKKVAEFYSSKEWKQTRKLYNLYRLNICERCGGIGYFVHHKQYITSKNVDDLNITLNFENLELLCKECHNKEHFKSEAEYNFDEDGQLIRPPIGK